MKRSEDKINNSTYIDCIYYAPTGRSYSISVWGYCFICYEGAAKT
ncbi:MAG: hypothetical protein ACI31C_00900 [Muribaculaceae bacterium]